VCGHSRPRALKVQQRSLKICPKRIRGLSGIGTELRYG